MNDWSEQDTGEYAPLPGKLFIATRALADAIENWLLNDCEANHDELARELVEDINRGWMNPEVEA